MAAALAACAPHAEAPVRSYAAEASVFEAPSVVIPHGTQEAEPVREPTPVVEDEPCDPVVSETVEEVSPEPVLPRIRGRVKRTAGKPMPRIKGDVAFVDPSAL
jgi:hypothetical protein